MYPTGTVTFLFTDLEESSRLWEEFPEAMKAALARHDAILRTGIEANRGIVVKKTGDGLHAVFDLPADALQAALDCQKALLAHSWESTGPLRVRMGLHTGQAQLREGDYYGPAVNRAARVMSVAAGGQVLLSMATTELVRDQLPDGLSLVDLGRHRLRSLDRQERLFQFEHPELPADFPPLKSNRTAPNNLPLQLSSFIGREKESTQLRELLSPDSPGEDQPTSAGRNRLITLTGPGGTGKSRLSMQVAGEIFETFPDGIWLIELAPLADPELVVQAVADPLGIREQPARPLVDLLVAYLRPLKILLILDNCEHLIDACARLAEALLHGCPQLHILASSREALGIAGERAFRVQSLSLPAEAGSLAEKDVAEYDAIRLFVARATDVKNDFELTDHNAIAVSQICRRLDGIPLAIELAAARIKVLSPQQILDRLDDRFRLLTGGSRTALPRQRTLQALIDWSYDLLTESECVLLRRLSVFSGGWTMEAAETVTGIAPLEPYDILDLLEQLGNKSLISAEEGELGMRYRMLESIRQYAQEKLAQSGEADKIRDRHLHFFVGQTQQAAEAMMALHNADWVERLAEDLDNHRAARSWALETDIPSALGLMAGLTPRGGRIFPVMEAFNYLETAIKLAESQSQFNNPEASAENRRLLGLALATASNLCLVLGNDKVHEYASQAAAIAREQDDVPTLVMALTLAASAEGSSGDIDAARRHYQELNPLLANLGQIWIKAVAMVTLGNLRIQPNAAEIIKAWDDWELGMLLFRRSGDIWGLALGHNMAGGASFILNDPDKAQYHAEHALELYDELGDTHMANGPRSMLANLARQHGDLDRATLLYKEIITGWRNVGQYGAMARCLECLAFIGRVRASESEDDSRALWLARSATLLGSAEIIRREYDSPMNVLERPEYEEEFAKIRQAAGEKEFHKAWKMGQAMLPDQAIDFIKEF